MESEDLSVPEMQWAVTSVERGKLQVKRIPVPKPGKGEILIKVLAAPINPSDLMFMKGYYEDYDVFHVQHPNVPGWEGCGIVIAAGGGITTWGWVGKRCSFFRKVHPNREKILGGAY